MKRVLDQSSGEPSLLSGYPTKRESVAPIVAHLGGEFSFTHLAARKAFTDASFRSCEQISSVFKEVSTGLSAYGIIPVESSSQGVFSSTLDELLASHKDGVRIVQEIVQQEKLALVTHPSLSELDIVSVVGHPVILEICSSYLAMIDVRRGLAGKQPLIRLPALDSTKACQATRADPTAAAISNKESAEANALSVLVAHVGYDANNETRYLVVSSTLRSEILYGISPPRRLKCTIAFGCSNVPGSIFRWSSCFALRDVNVIKAQSRPAVQGALGGTSGLRHFDSLFIVDYEVPEKEKNSALLTALSEFTTWLKILGSYGAVDDISNVEPNKDIEWRETSDILLS
jgi:prephenate dehydratase